MNYNYSSTVLHCPSSPRIDISEISSSCRTPVQFKMKGETVVDRYSRTQLCPVGDWQYLEGRQDKLRQNNFLKMLGSLDTLTGVVFD